MSDMTTACRNAYYGVPLPADFYYSSPLWYAHKLGEFLRRNGHHIPISRVRMSRGYSVRVGKVVYRAVEPQPGTITFERVTS